MAHDIFEIEVIGTQMAITAFRKNAKGARYGRTQTEFADVGDMQAIEDVFRGHQDTQYVKFDDRVYYVCRECWEGFRRWFHWGQSEQRERQLELF